MAVAAELTIWGPAGDHIPTHCDWYRYLWSRLHEDAPESMDFRHNMLKVITYNYDTSLERFLSRAALNLNPDINNEGDTAADSLVNGTVPVLHLHGALGDDAKVIHTARDRSQFLRIDLLQRLARGIRTVNEPEAERRYTQAHAWLQEAESVHILGFGFHNTNVKRLALKDLKAAGAKWQSFGATAVKLAGADRSRKEALLDLGPDTFHEMDCLSYLQSQVNLS